MTIFFIIVVLGLIVVLYIQHSSTGSGFSLFGSRGVDFSRSELVGTLLKLDEGALSELLRLYKQEFGAGPARYARKTYKKWQSGQVRAATSTYERFLVHLPKVMSFDLKCEVLRHFMEEYSGKDSYEMKVTTDDWEEKLTPLVHQIIDKAFTAQLPAEVERKLKWLVEGDMQAAQQILRHSQAEEGRVIVSMLREEFTGIENILSETHLKPRVKHMLEFPYGTITLDISRKMNSNG